MLDPLGMYWATRDGDLCDGPLPGCSWYEPGGGSDVGGTDPGDGGGDFGGGTTPGGGDSGGGGDPDPGDGVGFDAAASACR